MSIMEEVNVDSPELVMSVMEEVNVDSPELLMPRAGHVRHGGGES